MRAIAAAVAVLVALTEVAALAQPSGARDRALVQYRAGWDAMRSEDFAAAEKAFQAAVDIDATFELAHYMLGRARLAQKKFQAAAEALSQARNLSLSAASRKFSNTQEAQRYRRERLVEIDEMIRQLQTAPQTQQVQLQLRQLEEQRRQTQEHIRRGGDISITAYVPPYVSLSLGSAYFRMGNLAEAERFYKEAIATDSRAGEAHSNLAVVYLETGRLEEADQAVRAAERAGFRVHPDLKAQIRKRRREQW